MFALDFRRPINDSRTYISNAFGNWYEIQPGVWTYHPSIDIIFQTGNIAHCPIQSVAWGEVTYAQRVTQPGFEVWGNLIVVRTILPSGQVVFCRYAHVENMQCRRGQIIRPGQHIADVGNAFGVYAYHLDFGISKTNILATVPWDWPGTDIQRIYDNYVNPVSFIGARMEMASDYTALDAAYQNVQTATTELGVEIQKFKTGPVLPGTEVWTTDSLNVRPQPNLNNVPITSLPKGTNLRVVDAVTGWKQIVYCAEYPTLVGNYVSATYLTTNPM